MTDSYRGFAPVYDALMSDHPYPARAEYLLGLFRQFGQRPTLLLDLACGSGRLTLELAKRGVDVIAVDPSPDMLMLARDRFSEAGREALFLCQAGEDLDLYGTVDGAVCTLDSVNHIVEKDALREVFRRVALFLEPGCLFLFDVNTEHKHRDILADNTFVYERDELYCVWRNATEMPATAIRLDYFVRQGDGYHRGGESFEERAWSDQELTALLTQAGFRVEARFEDMTTAAPGPLTERIQYVVRRV